MTKEKDISKMETATLTEQWKNGELDVLFDVYVKIPDEGVRFRKIYYINQYLGTKLSDKIEILAPVPDYNHFVELTEKANQFSQMVKKVDELVTKCHRLEELLKRCRDSVEFDKREALGGGADYQAKILSVLLKEIDEVLKCQ